MKTRVAVFIDHSNVHHRLNESGWTPCIKTYNPAVLAEKLAGNRELAKVMFYCSAPHIDLQKDRPSSYAKQMKFYSEIEKMDNVEVRYASLKHGSDGSYYEKNLDTQMSTDMLMMAFKNEYEVAVIVSNDGDFADAVKNIRELGRRAEVAYFKGTLSFNLRKSADMVRRLRPGYFVDVYETPEQTKLV